jgi:hypothetical protein
LSAQIAAVTPIGATGPGRIGFGLTVSAPQHQSRSLIRDYAETLDWPVRAMPGARVVACN